MLLQRSSSHVLFTGHSLLDFYSLSVASPNSAAIVYAHRALIWSEEYTSVLYKFVTPGILSGWALYDLPLNRTSPHARALLSII